MAAFKNYDNGTWYVQFRYTDWRGERQQSQVQNVGVNSFRSWVFKTQCEGASADLPSPSSWPRPVRRNTC
ncbi:MAG: hypothetical protein KBA30_09230, partial [Clostridia bacterium]|nr:hypothetical protein [Clostridia bacterium]